MNLSSIEKLLRAVPEETETVSFSKEEAEELYKVIMTLSNGMPDCAFMWDGSDNLKDANTRALYKLYSFVGARVPVIHDDKPPTQSV